MRQPRDKVFITCAVTGNLTTPEQTPHLPITPEQIVEACVGAADAGAAIVHIHVRDPATGRPSMELDYYREVFEALRARKPDLDHQPDHRPRRALHSLAGRSQGGGARLHADACRRSGSSISPRCKPDICTLDLNTMNSGPDVVINTPANVRRMAKVMREIRRAAGDRAVRFRRHRAAARAARRRHARGPAALLLRARRALRLPAEPGDRALCPQSAAGGFGIHRLRHRPQHVHHGGAILSRRRPCAGRARGFGLSRQGRAGGDQCGDGGEGPPHRRGSRRPDRHFQEAREMLSLPEPRNAARAA